MTVSITAGLRGVEDVHQAAAGGTFPRTRIVDNVSVTGDVTIFNASNFPILATADAAAVTNAGGAATFPGPAITEGVNRVREPVATVAAFRALTTTPVANQTCFCAETTATYFWNPTSTTADDGDLIVKQTSITTGRWLKTAAVTGGGPSISVVNDPLYWLMKGA